MLYALGFIGFCIFAALAFAWLASSAPEGYEDADGWHPGKDGE